MLSLIKLSHQYHITWNTLPSSYKRLGSHTSSMVWVLYPVYKADSPSYGTCGKKPFFFCAKNSCLVLSTFGMGSSRDTNRNSYTKTDANPLLFAWPLLPWPLRSSTVYSPSGIHREKTMWWESRHLMVMKYQKSKLGNILPARIFATDEVISTRQNKDVFSDANTGSSRKHWPLGNS